MHIGVTGTSGFIGSHLLRSLKQLPDASVVTLQRGNKSAPPLPEELKKFVAEKDLIYHVGGVNRGTAEEILRGNVSGTLNLIEAIQSFGSRSCRIVFTSSSQVYKCPDKTQAVHEDCVAEPDNPYGISKKTAEDLFRISGLEAIILRLSNVYGPGCQPDYNSVIATFCDRATRGLPLIIKGDGNQGRDFIYIDDVVRALVLAGTQKQYSDKRIFNVSSGKITTLRQVVEAIRQAAGSVEAAYQPSEEIGGPSFCCEPTKFTDVYGWKPETSIEVGIRSTLQWFNERLGQ